ncbi:MAG: alpha-L-fucosidase [Candidatus Latescibacteria bacterium]|nr:alpha-L-fucosidase [Candidatus Latescibacterota bacterium]
MSLDKPHEIDRFDYSQIRRDMLELPVDCGKGPFEPRIESLQQYRCPQWFRDAKFGIWAHWGPQSVPMVGDWYARNMYIEDLPAYRHHLQHYGHPSQFGYKDILPLWKAECFDAEALIGLYRQVGARYFVALAVHPDNFDCWDSAYHRWNSVNIGPQKDIVGLWRDAARRQGLPFGVSEHVSNYFYWLGRSHGCDSEGPLAGVPYDGADPAYRDLYHSKFAADKRQWLTPEDFPREWGLEHYWRMRDLIGKYEPDLFYTDGALALGDISRNLLAYFYNCNMARNDGVLEAVYTLKNHPGLGRYFDAIGVFDIERGLAGEITREPWQIDTCLGNWFYDRGYQYKTARTVIHFLVDTVSKNGNMLLSVPLMPEGTVDGECRQILDDIRQWTELNGEAIYGTRPWRVYGENTSDSFAAKSYGEKPLEPHENELRFTRKGNSLYVFVMNWPNGRRLMIKSLAADMQAVLQVQLLGGDSCSFEATEQGLAVDLPHASPSEHASVLKIDLHADRVGRYLQNEDL